MEIKQLRHFLAIARTGSLSRAAVMLGVPQPLLSRQLRSLEEDVGAELVYRNGRGVVLTEAGRILQQHAESIVNSVCDAQTSIKAVSDSPTGEVVLGLPPMVGSLLTVPVVEAFRASYPNVSLRIVEAFSGYVLEWLTSARLDVAVIYNVVRSGFLVMEPLVEEELCLVAATDTAPPVEGPAVRMTDLAQIPLILPNQPHGLRSLVEGHLAKLGAHPTIALEVDGLSALLRLVEHGLAASVMSSGFASRLQQQGRLRAWPIVEPRMLGQLYLATSTQRPSTSVTRALARIVKSEVRAISAANMWRPIAEVRDPTETQGRAAARTSAAPTS